MTFRRYNAETDKAACQRIWRETGWMGEEKKDKETFDIFMAACTGWVAELDGEAECLVATLPGTVRHLQTDLPWCLVGGVTTSMIARKQGLATRLTAHAVAAGAAEGAHVAGLGMFDQGFYNRLGFGAGAYEVATTFDPGQLNVPDIARTPKRLGVDDWELIHASKLARARGHGAVTCDAAGDTHSELRWGRNGFGLGYCDGPNGELTHHLWCHTDHREPGPYHVSWLAYQTPAQLIELLSLVKAMGDQVRSVLIYEPAGIQLQDLLNHPFRHREMTAKSKHAGQSRVRAWWQMRMLDVPACMAATHLPGETLRFNLALSDPIPERLDANAPWQGAAGEYIITAGAESEAVSGTDPALPTLSASIGAFTRMWLAVRPATGLAVTDTLSGPGELLTQLDLAFRLPPPKPGWGGF